jgi:hypothetical protein
LADWFAEFHAELWDKEIEADAEAGRLDKFVAKAKAEIAAAGRRKLALSSTDEPAYVEQGWESGHADV